MFFKYLGLSKYLSIVITHCQSHTFTITLSYYCNTVTLSHFQVYTGEGISLASRHRVQFSEVLILTNDVT